MTTSTLVLLRELVDQSRVVEARLGNSIAEAILDGTSQVDVAQALGVSQSAVSQMLSRRRERTIGPYWTIPVLANHLRANRGMSSHGVIRACAQFVEDYRRISNPVDREVALGAPEPTGEQRLDCLIAGLSDYEARRSGLETPSWTVSDRYILFPSWFIVPSDGLKAWVMQVSPPEFTCRGVFLDPRDLESV